MRFYSGGVIVSYDDFVTRCYCHDTGNENLHYLTTDEKRQILRVDLEDWEGNKRYALYDNFRVAKEQFGFRLRSVGKYSGTAGRYDMKTYNNKLSYCCDSRSYCMQ